LGTTKRNLLRQVRHRHPEVKLPAKVFLNLRNTFGNSLTEYGEVKVKLDSPGGPQEHLCFTLYGLFLHGLYIRTEEARRFCRKYPEFLVGLATGRLKAPVRLAPVYQAILDAPRGMRYATVLQVSQTLGLPRSTIYYNLRKLREGCVTADGMPARRKRRQVKFAAEIRLVRLTLGDSQKGFARRLGVNNHTVRDWESGTWGLRRATIQRIVATCPNDGLRELFG
jgi:DNA-binding XRE family transcriptional regulator